MGYHSGPSGLVRHLDSVQGFGQCADLIHLDQNGVGRLFRDTAFEILHIGHEHIVAHNLTL